MGGQGARGGGGGGALFGEVETRERGVDRSVQIAIDSEALQDFVYEGSEAADAAVEWA